MSKKNYTTFDIARICDVQPATVAYWIEQKQLKAYKTPGGHRRVTPIHLLEFLRAHDMPIPDYLNSEHRPRVLIVLGGKNGDNDSAEELQATINGDYEVKVAQDPFQTGMLMAAFKPQCVVLYAETENESSMELCREINSANEDGKPTILLVGGKITAQTKSTMQKAGVRRCLPKDSSVADLYKAITTCLN